MQALLPAAAVTVHATLAQARVKPRREGYLRLSAIRGWIAWAISSLPLPVVIRAARAYTPHGQEKNVVRVLRVGRACVGRCTTLRAGRHIVAFPRVVRGARRDGRLAESDGILYIRRKEMPEDGEHRCEGGAASVFLGEEGGRALEARMCARSSAQPTGELSAVD